MFRIEIFVSGLTALLFLIATEASVGATFKTSGFFTSQQRPHLQLLDFAWHLEEEDKPSVYSNRISLRNQPTKHRLTTLLPWSDQLKNESYPTQFMSFDMKVLREQSSVVALARPAKARYASKARAVLREQRFLEIGRTLNERDLAIRQNALLGETNYLANIERQLNACWRQEIDSNRAPCFIIEIENDGTVQKIRSSDFINPDLSVTVACAEAISKSQFGPLPPCARSSEAKPLPVFVSMTQGVRQSSCLTNALFETPFNFTTAKPFLLPLKEKIWRWWMSEGFSSSAPIIRFTVEKSGTISSVELVQTSGDSYCDKACLSKISSLLLGAAPVGEAALPKDSCTVTINVGTGKVLSKREDQSTHLSPGGSNKFEFHPYNPKLGGI